MADSGPQFPDGKGRVRVINATTTSYDLTNIAADGAPLGKAVFGAQGVTDYQTATQDHLTLLSFDDFAGSYVASFAGSDLLALQYATVIVAGWQDSYHVFGCVDASVNDGLCIPAEVSKKK